MSNPLTNKKNLSIFTAVLGFMGLYAPNANGGWFWNRSPRVVYVTPQPRVVYATQPNVVVQPAPQVVVVTAPQVVQPTVTQTQVPAPAPVQLTLTPVANAPAPQAAPVTESSATTRTDSEQQVLNDLFDNLPKGAKRPVKDQRDQLFILTRGEDNFSAAPADIQKCASVEKACEGMKAGDARVVQIANETGLKFISAEKDDKSNIQYLQISLEKDKLPTVTMNDTSATQRTQISAPTIGESAQVAPVPQATPVVSQPVVVTQPTPVVVQQPTPVVVQPSLSAWQTVGVCADTARIFLDYYYGVRECWHYRSGRFERRCDYRPAPPPPRHYDHGPAPRMGGYGPRPNNNNRPSGRQGNVTIINNNVTNNTTNVNVYKETKVNIRRENRVWIDRDNRDNTGKRPSHWHKVPVTPQETTPLPSPASPGPGGGSAAPADRTTIDCTPTPTQQSVPSTPNRPHVEHKRRHSPVTVVQERPRPTTNPGNTNAGVPSTPSRNRQNPRPENPYSGSGTGHVYTNGSVVTTGSTAGNGRSSRGVSPTTFQRPQRVVQQRPSAQPRSVPQARQPAQRVGGWQQAPQVRPPQRSFTQPRMLHQAPSAGHMRQQSGRRGR